MSFVTQLIILLYLADNDTSWMVLFSSGIGLVIEGWKLQKALVVNVVWRPLGGGLVVPWVDVSDKEEDAATTQTRVYDDIATRHMLTVLVPLVMGQAGYSLVYDTHKSWYSWLIGSLTSSVYLFGFAQMTPQLYINYRLKSVAAMPWKTMSYKFLNTIIDDIFSFIVKVRWLSGKGGGGGGASYRPVPIVRTPTSPSVECTCPRTRAAIPAHPLADAHAAPPGVLPRRHHLHHLLGAAVAVPGGQVAQERVWRLGVRLRERRGAAEGARARAAPGQAGAARGAL